MAATAEKLKIKPLGDRVLVEPVDSEEKTSSGIIIPDAAKEKQQRGKVVAVGEGRITDEGKNIPVKVKVGDQILYGGWNDKAVKFGSAEYLIIKEEDILAIIG
jgi:chaperonin GroES